MVGGVGCSAHATGIKVAKPEMTVLCLLGDGDGLAIGGNQFIHAARRNIDLTAIIFSLAANHDGDSDSTASIAGQFHGAWKGVGAVPHRWARHIDVLVPLLRLTRGLLARHHAGA